MNFHQILEQHYRQHHKRLFKQYGEDATQEAYVRALQYQHSLKGLENFDGWFHMIVENARNKIKNEEKLHGMHMPLTDNIQKADEKVSDRFKKKYIRRIQEEIVTCTELDKYILELFYIDGFTIYEIEALVPKGKSSIHRLIVNFRKSIAEKYGKADSNIRHRNR